MSIGSIANDSATLKQAGKEPVVSQGGVRDPSPDAGTAEPVPADQVLLSTKLDSKFNAAQLKNERQNAAAGAIRHTDQAVQVLSQKIDSLKRPLEAIVKNFPPFSMQDKARLELLRSYSSLRQQIDQLTLPPPPDVAKAQKAAALPPPLPMTANDSQIADHLEKLDASSTDLAGIRAGLAADTAAVSLGQSFPGVYSGVNGGETAPVLTESAAAQKSVEVGRQFAQSIGQGVTVDHSKFLKGLS
jgi:hypothetical protein